LIAVERREDLLDLILSRRSCRAFSGELPAREDVERIVQAGRFGATARNCQCNRFYVITDPHVLAEITRIASAELPFYADKDCRYAAPMMILVTNLGSTCPIQDASCAMQNMMLAATALGVGSCWVNQPYRLDKSEAFRELIRPLGVGDEEMICASLALGMPKESWHPTRLEHKGNPVFWPNEEK